MILTKWLKAAALRTPAGAPDLRSSVSYMSITTGIELYMSYTDLRAVLVQYFVTGTQQQGKRGGPDLPVVILIRLYH